MYRSAARKPSWVAQVKCLFRDALKMPSTLQTVSRPRRYALVHRCVLRLEPRSGLVCESRDQSRSGPSIWPNVMTARARLDHAALTTARYRPCSHSYCS